MKEYLKAQNKTNETILGNTFSSDELDRFSQLKLNDIRTASVNRILYQQSGRIPPSSDTYKQIEKLVLQKYFPGFYHDFEQNLQTAASLNERLKEAISHNNVLKAENEQLKAELENLQNHISASKAD